MSRFPASFPSPRLALGAAAVLAALGLSPGPAQAALTYRVTVNSVEYDVTTFTGTYNSNASKFATAANGGVMPWWGSKTIAAQFATAVGGDSSGPYFAYTTSGSIVVARYFGDGPATGNNGLNINTGISVNYAQATLHVTSPVPAPLPAFGAAAAFGFSRKLRKRIQASRVPAGSRQPLASLL